MNITETHGEVTPPQLRAGAKMTVFFGEDSRSEHQRLYDRVMAFLIDGDIAGATVIKGDMSFGSNRRIHSRQNEITMDNLPIIVEVVGETAKIDRAARQLSEMLGHEGMVEVQPTTFVDRMNNGPASFKKGRSGILLAIF